MGSHKSSLQRKISSEDLSVIRQETGFSEKEVLRLFERFCDIDREGKRFLFRTDCLTIPEISLNPVGDRMAYTLFKKGNSNKENDCLIFKNIAQIMSCRQEQKRGQVKICFLHLRSQKRRHPVKTRKLPLTTYHSLS